MCVCVWGDMASSLHYSVVARGTVVLAECRYDSLGGGINGKICCESKLQSLSLSLVLVLLSISRGESLFLYVCVLKNAHGRVFEEMES